MVDNLIRKSRWDFAYPIFMISFFSLYLIASNSEGLIKYMVLVVLVLFFLMVLDIAIRPLAKIDEQILHIFDRILWKSRSININDIHRVEYSGVETSPWQVHIITNTGETKINLGASIFSNNNLCFLKFVKENLRCSVENRPDTNESALGMMSMEITEKKLILAASFVLLLLILGSVINTYLH